LGRPKCLTLGEPQYFCFGRRFSKHKMTIYAKNLGWDGPLGPPGYAYITALVPTSKASERQVLCSGSSLFNNPVSLPSSRKKFLISSMIAFLFWAKICKEEIILEWKKSVNKLCTSLFTAHRSFVVCLIITGKVRCKTCRINFWKSERFALCILACSVDLK